MVFLPGRVGDLRLVFRAQLLLARLAVLQVAIRHRLLQHIEARQLEHRGGVTALVETFLGRLLGHQPRADQVVEREVALLRGEFTRALARDPLDVELVEIPADGAAVHGRNRRRGVGGRHGALGLAAADSRERHEQDTGVVHAEFSGVLQLERWDRGHGPSSGVRAMMFRACTAPLMSGATAA